MESALGVMQPIGVFLWWISKVEPAVDVESRNVTELSSPDAQLLTRVLLLLLLLFFSQRARASLSTRMVGIAMKFNSTLGMGLKLRISASQRPSGNTGRAQPTLTLM